MSKDAFLAKKVLVKNHVPSVDLGAFDIHFHPAQHKMHIVVKFALEKSDPTAQLQLQRFSTAYKKMIPKIWNGKASIRCMKDGWRDVFFTPTFAVKPVQVNEAHYRIKVQPETDQDHMVDSNPVGVVQPTSSMSGPGFQPRDALLGAKSTADKGIKSYARNVRWNLTRAQVVPLKSAGSMVWKPMLDPVGWERVKGYAREISQFKVPKKFRSSTRPKVKIQGCGPTGREELAKTVHKYLSDFGMKNPVEIKGDGSASDPVSVKLSMDDKEVKALFPYREAQSNSVFKQSTVAHEFGHMLGLPDEYLCMHARTQDAMKEIYSLDDKGLKSFSGGAANAIAMNPEAKNVKHQQAYIKLCSRAGVPAPDFDKLSSSIMSNGEVLNPWHYVTLWEAVCQFSGFNDWRIQMPSMGAPGPQVFNDED